jgi:hypothetical protein
VTELHRAPRLLHGAESPHCEGWLLRNCITKERAIR